MAMLLVKRDHIGVATRGHRVQSRQPQQQTQVISSVKRQLCTAAVKTSSVK